MSGRQLFTAHARPTTRGWDLHIAGLDTAHSPLISVAEWRARQHIAARCRIPVDSFDLTLRLDLPPETK